MKLYKIASDIRRVLDEATDSETGELLPDAEQRLDALGMAFEDKAESICCVMREQATLASAVQAEIDRLKKLLQVRENAQDRLKAYLKFGMEAAGIPKLETERFKLRIQKNPPSATATKPAEMLPEEFRRVVTTISANNAAAIAHWKEHGEAPEGFEIKQGTHLRVS